MACLGFPVHGVCIAHSCVGLASGGERGAALLLLSPAQTIKSVFSGGRLENRVYFLQFNKILNRGQSRKAEKCQHAATREMTGESRLTAERLANGNRNANGKGYASLWRCGRALRRLT